MYLLGFQWGGIWLGCSALEGKADEEAKTEAMLWGRGWVWNI